jgi:hypothetical protein
MPRFWPQDPAPWVRKSQRLASEAKEDTKLLPEILRENRYKINECCPDSNRQRENSLVLNQRIVVDVSSHEIQQFRQRNEPQQKHTKISAAPKNDTMARTKQVESKHLCSTDHILTMTHSHKYLLFTSL